MISPLLHCLNTFAQLAVYYIQCLSFFAFSTRPDNHPNTSVMSIYRITNGHSMDYGGQNYFLKIPQHSFSMSNFMKTHTCQA